MQNLRLLGSIIKKKYPKVVDPFKCYLRVKIEFVVKMIWLTLANYKIFTSAEIAYCQNFAHSTTTIKIL